MFYQRIQKDLHRLVRAKATYFRLTLIDRRRQFSLFVDLGQFFECHAIAVNDLLSVVFDFPKEFVEELLSLGAVLDLTLDIADFSALITIGDSGCPSLSFFVVIDVACSRPSARH
jgi:hypothetical protein